ncbi:hypothetical protein E2C01_057289 [Portunus trituberculatus]|uniref:Uncharacterized protein n=1 Tax=Portunus trituberculatus TaxID=210409 RepID=A0A5B7H036_PORTR|nr:hypothetical protein [Portunus trituberculatus]
MSEKYGSEPPTCTLTQPLRLILPLTTPPPRGRMVSRNPGLEARMNKLHTEKLPIEAIHFNWAGVHATIPRSPRLDPIPTRTRDTTPPSQATQSPTHPPSCSSSLASLLTNGDLG